MLAALAAPVITMPRDRNELFFLAGLLVMLAIGLIAGHLFLKGSGSLDDRRLRGRTPRQKRLRTALRAAITRGGIQRT